MIQIEYRHKFLIQISLWRALLLTSYKTRLMDTKILQFEIWSNKNSESILKIDSLFVLFNCKLAAIQVSSNLV